MRKTFSYAILKEEISSRIDSQKRFACQSRYWQKEEQSYDVTIKNAAGGHVDELRKDIRRTCTEYVP